MKHLSFTWKKDDYKTHNFFFEVSSFYLQYFSQIICIRKSFDNTVHNIYGYLLVFHLISAISGQVELQQFCVGKYYFRFLIVCKFYHFNLYRVCIKVACLLLTHILLHVSCKIQWQYNSTHDRQTPSNYNQTVIKPPEIKTTVF